MAIMLLGSVVQLRGQRRQLCGRQRLARATQDCEEYRVHSEDLPRDVADGEVGIVQIAPSDLVVSPANCAVGSGSPARPKTAKNIAFTRKIFQGMLPTVKWTLFRSPI